MKHPLSAELALFAGGDLQPWRAWLVRRHVRWCEVCRRQVESYRLAAPELWQELDVLPPDVDWNSLAAEMKANIRLGLEAGQCVGPAEAPQQGRFPRLDPRFAVVLASASLVVVMGWWLGSSPVPEESEAPEVRAAHAVVLEAGREGVRVQSRGSALSLLAPSREPVTVSVSLEGSARVRYVDAETGQVTIQDVYAE